jgi:hypothetical protein
MNISDPLFWKEFKAHARDLSVLCDVRLSVLYKAIDATAAEGGEIWECGAYKGGTAMFLKYRVRETNRIVRLFDTFNGIPYHGQYDIHGIGSMKASTREQVAALFEGIDGIFIHQGIMPQSFSGLEDRKISVAHVDCDQYESVKGCLEFCYPRVHSGGYIVIDDFNCGSCPGAKVAANEFLNGRPEVLVARGGNNPQAHFIKV